MSKKIPVHFRLLVADRANYRCEYCHVPELFLATTFHIDHIFSQRHGGKTILENLAFCCPHCNQNKGTDVAMFVDDGLEETIRFFNPRRDNWNDHFEIKDGIIAPKTKIAEVTIRTLDFNLPERVMLRRELIRGGHF